MGLLGSSKLPGLDKTGGERPLTATAEIASPSDLQGRQARPVHLFCRGLWIAGLLFCSGSVVLPAGRADFSGRWRLDREVSEDPVAKVEAILGVHRSILNPDRGYGPSGGPRGAGRSAPPGGVRPPVAVLKNQIQAIFEGDDLLQITQTPIGLVILKKDGRQRTIQTAGKKPKKKRGERVSRGRFKKDGRLVVTSILDNNREMLEVFERGPGVRQFTLRTTLSGDRWTPEITFRRVYQLGHEAGDGEVAPTQTEPSGKGPAGNPVVPASGNLLW